MCCTIPFLFAYFSCNFSSVSRHFRVSFSLVRFSHNFFNKSSCEAILEGQLSRRFFKFTWCCSGWKNFLLLDKLTFFNSYKVGLFWRFLWLGGGRIPPPLHNFGTINDDVIKLSTDVLHQQKNKLTSSFFWLRHYFFYDVIMFVKLWPDTLCHSKSVYSRCIAYCRM